MTRRLKPELTKKVGRLTAVGLRGDQTDRQGKGPSFVWLLLAAAVALGLFSAPAAASSEPTVDGWVISWSRGGRYEVQVSDGSAVVCEGGRSCDVKSKGFGAGDYTVFNRTNNKQWTVVVEGDDGGTESDPFAGLPFNDGQIVAADHAVDNDPINLWKYMTNGFYEGGPPFDNADDTQIVHRSGGDPLPGLDGQVHPDYRRMHTAGPQSLWDAANQPDHTRAQLGGWGRYSNIHISEEGDREFIVYSVRLDPDSPIPGSVLTKDGLYHLSKVSQIKSLPGTSSPTISVDEGYDGLQLIVREGEEKRFIRIADVPRGVWLRIGIDVLWSSGDDGAYRWWGDLDGDDIRDFEPLSERRSTPTLMPGADAAAMNIGPYHTLQVPRNGRDYANIEYFNHPVNDPWG